jgi:hypothetical protein
MTQTTWRLEQHQSGFFLCMNCKKMLASTHRIARIQLPVIESKYSSGNIECDVLGYSSNIPVECPSHIIIITEDECLLEVKPNSYDIRRIRPGIRLYLLYCPLLREYVSSSVNMIMSGTSNTSCNHLYESQQTSAMSFTNQPTSNSSCYLVNSNGTVCPTCILSLLGPRPVYKKNGSPRSYRSKIRSKSR